MAILLFTNLNVIADTLLCGFHDGIVRVPTDGNTIGDVSIGLGDATWNRLNVQNLKNYKNMSEQDIQTWYNERIVPKDPSEDDPRDYYVVKPRLRSNESKDRWYSEAFLKREREQLEFGNKFEFGPLTAEPLFIVFFKYQNERLTDILSVKYIVNNKPQEGDFYNFWAVRDINDSIISHNNKSVFKFNDIMDNGYNVGMYIDYNILSKERSENGIKFFIAYDDEVRGFNSKCAHQSIME